MLSRAQGTSWFSKTSLRIKSRVSAHLFGLRREFLPPPFGAVYEDGDTRQEVRQHAVQ